jgi:hypothetical protein
VTLQLALSTAAGCILLSDSQGSTTTSETHGHQKQYIGEDFLVGGAGDSILIDALYHALSQRAQPVLRAVELAAFVEQFFRSEVRPDAAREAELLLVTPDADGKMVQRFIPGLLARCGRRSAMSAIGAGADFTRRAVRRDHEIGVTWPTRSVVDLLIMADEYADAANESLTVNDQLLISVLIGDRTYAMGHASIKATHLPDPIRSEWQSVSSACTNILQSIRLIRDARRHAFLACSRVLEEPDGTQDFGDERQTLEEQVAAIRVHWPALKKRVADYINWYDKLLGRGASAV